MYVCVPTQRGVPTHRVYPHVHTTVYIPMCICRYLYYPLCAWAVRLGVYEGGTYAGLLWWVAFAAPPCSVPPSRAAPLRLCYCEGRLCAAAGRLAGPLVALRGVLSASEGLSASQWALGAPVG